MSNKGCFAVMYAVLLLGLAPLRADIRIADPENAAAIVELGETKIPAITMDWFTRYIERVCGKGSQRISAMPASAPPVLLIFADPSRGLELGVPWPSELTDEEAYVIRTYRRNNSWQIISISKSSQGLRQALLHLLRSFRQEGKLLFTKAVNAAQQPWVPEREVFFLSFPRPQTFQDPSQPADLRLDVQGYSPDQLDHYVDMFMTFGFNGWQIPDSQYIWSVMGSTMDEGRERNHQLFRRFAQRIRLYGGSTSGFILGGAIGEKWRKAYTSSALEPEFQAAVEKWNAKTVHDRDEVEDPFLREFHSRWYSNYAKVADEAQRILIHWGEPHSPLKWRSADSQLRMHKFALEHFEKQNPDIKTGVNIWASWNYEDFLRLAKKAAFPEGHLFLENGNDSMWGWEERRNFREALARNGYQAGIWGWYLEDMETDQLAFMGVNDLILKEHYMQVRDKLDPMLRTRYVSVLDGAHMVNIYTLYVASRLLWDPYQQTEDLLLELTDGIWGPVAGRTVLEALRVIRDLRTGPTWKYFWSWSHERRLGTDDPARDRDRARAAKESLERIQIDPDWVPKFPLPLSPRDLVELIVPNLEQIALHAENRLILNQMLEAFARGQRLETLREMEKQMKPIGNLGTWVGSFGQLESIYFNRVLNRELVGVTHAGPRTWDPNSLANPFALWNSIGDAHKAFDDDLATAWFSNYPPVPHSSRPTFRDDVRIKTMPPKDLGFAWLEPQRVSRVQVHYLNRANAPSDPEDVEIQYWDGKDWRTAAARHVTQGPGPQQTVEWNHEIDPVTAKWFRVYFHQPIGNRDGAVAPETRNWSLDQPDACRPAVSEIAFWDGSRRLETEFRKIELGGEPQQ